MQFVSLNKRECNPSTGTYTKWWRWFTVEFLLVIAEDDDRWHWKDATSHRRFLKSWVNDRSSRHRCSKAKCIEPARQARWCWSSHEQADSCLEIQHHDFSRRHPWVYADFNEQMITEMSKASVHSLTGAWSTASAHSSRWPCPNMEISRSMILFSSVSITESHGMSAAAVIFEKYPLISLLSTYSHSGVRSILKIYVHAYPWLPETYRSWYTRLQPQWKRTAIRRKTVSSQEKNTVVDVALTRSNRKRKKNTTTTTTEFVSSFSSSTIFQPISQGEREEQEGPTPERSEQYNIGFSLLSIFPLSAFLHLVDGSSNNNSSEDVRDDALF